MAWLLTLAITMLVKIPVSHVVVLEFKTGPCLLTPRFLLMLTLDDCVDNSGHWVPAAQMRDLA